MRIRIREYTKEDVEEAVKIWNQVVEDGVAFPQEENLTKESGDAFFKEQTYTSVAENEETREKNDGKTNYKRCLFLKSKIRAGNERRHSDSSGFAGYIKSP